MLLGEISDYRAQRRNIEEESGESYCIKKEVKTTTTTTQ